MRARDCPSSWSRSCPQLDALFLAFPVSFKDRLVQYTGHLMRARDGKTSVRVYHYADTRVPVLRAMHMRRLATYRALGFEGAQTGAGRVGPPKGRQSQLSDSQPQPPIPILSS